MLTPTQIIQQGPLLDDLDIMPRFYKLDLEIISVSSHNLKLFKSSLTFAIQKNKKNPETGLNKITLMTPSQITA